MSEDEGVTPFEKAADAFLEAVTPTRGEAALGAWRSHGGAQTLSRDNAAVEAGTSSQVNQRGRGGCMSGLELRRDRGKACEGQPRSEPDRGNLAVRDRRGACRNVDSMGAGLRPGGKPPESPP
jgi:hypothetical protein